MKICGLIFLDHPLYVVILIPALSIHGSTISVHSLGVPLSPGVVTSAVRIFKILNGFE